MVMTKKRLLISLLALCLCVAACLGLASCGGDGKNAVVHVLEHHEANDSTCTEEGNIEYWSCSHCDKLFADAEGKETVASVTVAKKPHSIADDAYHAAVLPDCETAGTLAYWECRVCHGKFANQAGTKELVSIVDPAAHVFKKIKEVSLTFTEPVAIEYFKFINGEDADPAPLYWYYNEQTNNEN